MNLDSLIILAGGAGSGPNAPCPQCGPHKFEEGDKVRLKPGAKVTSQGGGKAEPVPNSVHRVINVLPAVGSAPQQVAVQSVEDQKEGKYGNFGYANANDLILHEPRQSYQPWTKPEPGTLNKNKFYEPKLDKKGFVVAPEPRGPQIQKGQKLTETRTSDGAKLTVLRPKDSPETNVRNLSQEEHPAKGSFGLISKVDSDDSTTRIYSTTVLPAHLQEGRETTVWVNSRVSEGRISGVTVREQNTTTHGQKTSTYTFDYKVPQKSFSKGAAAAVGMLKERYGIKLSLKRLRGS